MAPRIRSELGRTGAAPPRARAGGLLRRRPRAVPAITRMDSAVGGQGLVVYLVLSSKSVPICPSALCTVAVTVFFTGVLGVATAVDLVRARHCVEAVRVYVTWAVAIIWIKLDANYRGRAAGCLTGDVWVLIIDER